MNLRGKEHQIQHPLVDEYVAISGVIVNPNYKEVKDIWDIGISEEPITKEYVDSQTPEPIPIVPLEILKPSKSHRPYNPSVKNAW